MKFTFVTLFRELIEGYFSASILKKAVENKHIEIAYANPRDYTTNKFHQVDDTLFGGGVGMLMQPQPMFDLLSQLDKPYIIILTPSGKSFNQKDAKRLAKKSHIVFVATRYEGLDERVIETFADEVFSIGDYVLTGGELPALVMCDAIARNIKGVLGNYDSLEVESFDNYMLEAPSFTKPAVFDGLSVSSELLKGNHSKILDFKKNIAKMKTKYYRPDLYKMTPKDRR